MENKRERPGREVLFDLYVTQHLTQREMVGALGVSQKTVVGWLRDADIAIRNKSDALRKDPSRTELYDLYVAQEWSMEKIGQHYGVSATCVMRWLRRHEIQARTSAEAGHIAMGKKRPDSGTLRALYLDEKLSCTQIGERYGVTKYAALKWLHREGITIRPNAEGKSLAATGKKWSEAMKQAQATARSKPEYRVAASLRQRGEKSHLWRGGKMDGEIIRMQRVEWKIRRGECYERDNWTCQECGVHCHGKGAAKIQAHHIIGRRNGGTDDLDNLVTLCQSCHHKREWRERKEVK